MGRCSDRQGCRLLGINFPYFRNIGVTRRQARTVVKEAHKEWLDAFNDEDINQRELLFQCLGRLERTARKAEESGNFACVIGAVQLMNRMMALGADQKGFRGHSNHHHHANRR